MQARIEHMHTSAEAAEKQLAADISEGADAIAADQKEAAANLKRVEKATENIKEGLPEDWKKAA